MLRSGAAQAALVIVLAAPAGVVVATMNSAEPDGTSPGTSVPESLVPDESAPTSTVAGDPDGPGGGPPPGDVDVQVDIVLGLASEEEINDYLLELAEQRELHIRVCMNEAGFDYNPDISDVVDVDPLSELSPVEYAERWGFGIYTALDPENNPSSGFDEGWVWPSEEIVSELSTSEQDAWFEVNNRCSREARSGSEPWRNPMVQQALEDLSIQVEADPRMHEANAAWQDCMEAAGHPYASVSDMYDEWHDWERQQEFWEAEAWEPGSEKHAEWQALVELEIEVAVANAECSAAVDEVRRQVVADLRPGFVEVWQAIDWSLPPVTDSGDELVGTGGPFIEEGVETLPVDSDDEPSPTTEP